MSTYINIDLDKMNRLSRDAEATHREELEAISQLSGRVGRLVSQGGGFRSTKISASLMRMLGMVDNNLLPLMRDKFSLSEEGIKAFIRAADNVDTYSGK